MHLVYDVKNLFGLFYELKQRLPLRSEGEYKPFSKEILTKTLTLWLCLLSLISKKL